MAVTLSHGYIKPASPDTGDVFWPALSGDIQLMNDHLHDGTLGNILPTVIQTILAANWVAVVGQAGNYSQTITVPSQLSYDSAQLNFKLSNGTQIFPTVTRVSSSQFVVYTNDNTQNFVVVYSS